MNIINTNLLQIKLEVEKQISHWSGRSFEILISKIILIVFDFIALVLSWFSATFLTLIIFDTTFFAWYDLQGAYRFISWVTFSAFSIFLFLFTFKHYNERKPFWTENAEILKVVMLTSVLDLALLSITRFNSSRVWWALVWFLALIFITIFRNISRFVMCKYQIWQRPTIIIGVGNNAKDTFSALKSEVSLGFEIVSYIDTSLPVHIQDYILKLWSSVAGVQFVLALEQGQFQTQERLLRQLALINAKDVTVVPAMRGVPLHGTDMYYFFSHEVAMLKLRNNSLFLISNIIKRLLDLILVIIILPLLILPMMFISFLIRKDGGPSIFVHERIGKSGRIFKCFKFRTMSENAELQLKEILDSNEDFKDEWNNIYKLHNDPRITKIGKFLRKTSLDELPQLINVLLGEMSLVGPRPIVKEELVRYGVNVEYLLMVRPGITGLWQVSGRSDTNYEKRVYLDTWYIKNWSIWYDIVILFKTLKTLFTRKGSY